ncbi:MAG TPA: hypothetical protein VMC48_02440 [Methanobacterium sp.]|nr:hypothetical protein [Methanobacterium sp.]
MKKSSKNKDLEEEITILIDQKADLSEEISHTIIDEPQLLETILKGVSSETARVRFRSAKILKIISTKNPELLIEHWDFFIGLLDSDNKIILWNALDIIANLTLIDIDRFDKIYPRYYHFLEDESMVTTAHVVDNSATIISNHPKLEEEITQKLLNMNEVPRSGECHDILSGKVLTAFDSYFQSIKDKKTVLEFAHNASQSKRNATKVRADKFIKKYEG